jgi:hypothetical protein
MCSTWAGGSTFPSFVTPPVRLASPEELAVADTASRTATCRWPDSLDSTQRNSGLSTNQRQEPWKAPVPEFIEHQGSRQFRSG